MASLACLTLALMAGRLDSAVTLDWSTCTRPLRHRGPQVVDLLIQLLRAAAEYSKRRGRK